MSTPVSWFLIEPGWVVESSDGAELGRVEEVTGDSNADLFDGITVAAKMLGQRRYVPAELVGEIVEGTVRLNLDRAAFEHLRESGGPSPEARPGVLQRVLERLRVGRR
jgi:hypothetical protein